MTTKKNKNNNSTIAPLPKHGVHVPPGLNRPVPQGSDVKSTDPEEPLDEPMDLDELPWESADERTLRDESEDPDAPLSL